MNPGMIKRKHQENKVNMENNYNEKNGTYELQKGKEKTRKTADNESWQRGIMVENCKKLGCKKLLREKS